MTTRFNDSTWDHQREHRRPTALDEARMEVQRRLRKDNSSTAATAAPRYDGVYFDGLNWLATLS